MKRVRITYPGAYHHAMNRGYDGNDIFTGNKKKVQFLDLLEGTAKKLKIHLFAFCVMDNHYHMVLENNNERMSDFFGQLNGLYGMYYRKVEGGKGYVFQSRYKSTLIGRENGDRQEWLLISSLPEKAACCSHQTKSALPPHSQKAPSIGQNHFQEIISGIFFNY